MLEEAKNPFAPTLYEARKERIAKGAQIATLLMAIALIIPMMWIIGLIFVKGWPAMSIDYLWQNPVGGGVAGGIWGPLIGTFFLTLMCLLIVAPIGVMAGIYLNEYAPDNKATRIIMIAVTSLAGVPSIVHALFGLAAFVVAMHMGKSLIAAACTLAIMTLPVIITSTREALGAVPRNFREACWNLGASKWQTIRTIVLPNSISGILTGVILVVSRAAGETAPIMLTGAAAYLPLPNTMPDKLMPYYLGDQFLALAMHLNVIARDVPNMPTEMKFGSALVMLLLILLINSAAIALRIRLRRRKRW
jgi:phosphate transport system permease protein